MAISNHIQLSPLLLVLLLAPVHCGQDPRLGRERPVPEEGVHPPPDFFDAFLENVSVVRAAAVVPMGDDVSLVKEQVATCLTCDSVTLCLNPEPGFMAVEVRAAAQPVAVKWPAAIWVDENGVERGLDARLYGDSSELEVMHTAKEYSVLPNRHADFEAWQEGKEYYVQDSQIGAAIFREPWIPALLSGSVERDEEIVRRFVSEGRTVRLEIPVVIGPSRTRTFVFDIGLAPRLHESRQPTEPALLNPDQVSRADP